MTDVKAANAVFDTLNDTPQHHFLIAGEIVIKAAEDSVPTAVRLNTVIQSKTGTFPVSMLARTQQALQLTLSKRMTDIDLEVLDVVIIGIMPLGYMTNAQFNDYTPPAPVAETPAAG